MATDQPLPAKVDLTLYRGDTRVWTDVIEENVGTDDAPEWAPKDLTGHTFLAQIRPDRDRSDVIATIDVEATDAVNGEIVRTLTAAQADLLGDHNARLFWDLQVTRTSDGFVRTYMAGSVKVMGDASDV